MPLRAAKKDETAVEDDVDSKIQLGLEKAARALEKRVGQTIEQRMRRLELVVRSRATQRRSKREASSGFYVAAAARADAAIALEQRIHERVQQLEQKK